MGLSWVHRHLGPTSRQLTVMVATDVRDAMTESPEKREMDAEVLNFFLTKKCCPTLAASSDGLAIL